MAKPKADMIKGTLDMLILKVLSLGAMHGWGITERIQQVSKDALQVNQGSLYASLHRLTREGWIGSQWKVTENGRRARYYMLTPAGQQHLSNEQEHWTKLADAVARVLALSALSRTSLRSHGPRRLCASTTKPRSSKRV